MTRIRYSVFTVPPGHTLGKMVSWANGMLVKTQQPDAAGATVQTRIATSLTEFMQQVLSERQALVSGVCQYEEAEVCTARRLPALIGRGAYVARTRACFQFEEAPGVLFLDHDPKPGSKPYTELELVNLLRTVVPGFVNVTIGQKVSSSSHLIAPDGNQVSGLSGQHLFAIVSNAQFIPMFGTRINQYFWLAGHGWYDVAANGALRPRTPFDGTVWQPERMAFTRAACRNGVRQWLPTPKVFAGALDHLFGEFPLEEELIPQLSDDELRRVSELQAEAAAAVQPEAARKREAWVASRTDEIIARSPEGLNREQVRTRILEALDGGILPLDLILISEHGEQVTVGDLLADPDRWHEKRFADPIEPDYRGDRRIAIAYLKDTRIPLIYSHARGEMRYPLVNNRSALSEFEDLTLLPSGQTLRRKFQPQSAADFARGAPASWIIKNVLPAAGLAMIYGPSGSGKTFITLDMLWALATGSPWAGHATKRLRVVYVAAEGRAGLRMRLRAFENARGASLSDLPFDVISDTPDLRTADVDRLIAEIEENGGADVVAIDTLAQATSGADENSGQDMGPVLTKCAELIEQLGATVLLLHHSGKEASKGSRGWSGIKGALDAEFRVERHEHHSSITISKQKDGPEGETVYFELQTVYLGEDADGDPTSSCTVRLLDSVSVQRADPKGRRQTQLLAKLRSLEEFGPVKRDVLLEAVLEEQAADCPGQDPVRKDALVRSLSTLERAGRLLLKDGLVSSTNATSHHKA